MSKNKNNTARASRASITVPAINGSNVKKFLLVSYTNKLFSFTRINKTSSEKLQTQNNTNNQKATNLLFHSVKNDNGKNKLIPELQDVIDIQESAEAYYKINTLELQFSSNRILPLDKFNQFDNQMQNYRVQLDSAMAKFVNNYDDIIKAEKIALGSGFDAGLYKDKETYRSQVAIMVKKFPIDTATVDEDIINDIIKSRHAKVLEPLEHAFKAIKNYADDTSQKFTKNSIDNLKNAIAIAKSLEVYPDSNLNTIFDGLESFISRIDVVSLRHDDINTRKQLCSPTISKLEESIKAISENMEMFA